MFIKMKLKLRDIDIFGVLPTMNYKYLLTLTIFYLFKKVKK